MSFLIPAPFRKKRVKFKVELAVLQLTDVPLLNGTIFAKVRLLECGHFTGYTWHRRVRSYQVDFMHSHHHRPQLPSNSSPSHYPPAANGSSTSGAEEENPQPFHFQVRIPFDERTGELDSCRCKISLRKEDRVGRQRPQKMGYVAVNLAEFAATGSVGITQSFLLDPYYGATKRGGVRQDNSRVNVRIRMMHQARDPLFKVPKAHYSPLNTLEDAQLNPLDRKAPGAYPGDASFSSMTASMSSSIAKPRLDDFPPPTPPSLSQTPQHAAQQSHQQQHSTQQKKSSVTSASCNSASAPNSESLSNSNCPPNGGISSLPTIFSAPATTVNESTHHPNNHRSGSVASTTTPTASNPSDLTTNYPTNAEPIIRSSWHAPPLPSTSNHHHPMSTSWDAGANSGSSAHPRRMSEERMLAGGGSLGPASGSSALANRVQRTRRDAEGVIEEVLAESSVMMGSAAVPWRRGSAGGPIPSSSSAVEVDACGEGEAPSPSSVASSSLTTTASMNAAGRASAEPREDHRQQQQRRHFTFAAEGERGLALYISRDGKVAAVDGENIGSAMQDHSGGGLMLVSEPLEYDSEGDPLDGGGGGGELLTIGNPRGSCYHTDELSTATATTPTITSKSNQATGGIPTKPTKRPSSSTTTGSTSTSFSSKGH